MCVLTLADKLMEETEELCLQREQREVGAHRGCSESPPFPPPHPPLGALDRLGVRLGFWHERRMQGCGAPREPSEKSDWWSRRASEMTVLEICSSFLARHVFPLASPGEQSLKGRWPPSRE